MVHRLSDRLKGPQIVGLQIFLRVGDDSLSPSVKVFRITEIAN